MNDINLFLSIPGFETMARVNWSYPVILVAVGLGLWVGKSRMRGLKWRPSKRSVEMEVSGITIKGVWEPDERECQAAWELYTELVTRTATVELKDDEGLLCEALDSLHQIFSDGRTILRKYGPAIGIPSEEGGLSCAYIAVAVLNSAIRPVLAKWHPLMEHWHSKKPKNSSRWEHEASWERAGELREDLRKARKSLRAWASELEKVLEVPSLVDNK